MEMKTNVKNEEAVLLKAVNGEKKGPNDQVTVVVSEQGDLEVTSQTWSFSRNVGPEEG